jgi:hypothetical protein
VAARTRTPARRPAPTKPTTTKPAATGTVPGPREQVIDQAVVDTLRALPIVG